MDIQAVLQEYDSMFGRCALEQIDAYLAEKLEEAYREKDYYSAITLWNERMGFCRDTSQKEKGISSCRQMLKLVEQMGLQGTVEYATALQNAANAYRAFGMWEEAMTLYKQVEEIYHQKVEQTDFLYASLYNNWSLLYQEMDQFDRALVQQKKALEVVDAHADAGIEQATTRTNLAVSLLRLYQEQKEEALYTQAMTYLQQALEIHEADGCGNFHYSAVVAALGDACYIKGDDAQAAMYYKKAMQEQYRHTGDTDAYRRICANYQMACERAGMAAEEETHLARCRRFYQEYARPLLVKEFGAVWPQVAVGLVGEGSECFGFADAISTDHDFGIGFCIWLPDALYQEIGDKLQQAYTAMLQQYITEETQTELPGRMLCERRGVFSIADFYGQLLGDEFAAALREDQLTERQWLLVSEEMLATATNGEVFEDGLGEFTKLRDRLQAYYPERVWRKRLAKALHDFSQYGQSNYARMMARGDDVTARLCVGRAVESAMELVYLLNRTYAPYYKWKRRGMNALERLPQIDTMLAQITALPGQRAAWDGYTYTAQEINAKDEICTRIEAVAAAFLQELTAQGLARGTDLFLERYSKELMMKEQREQRIEEIVALEWEQFDRVENEGGRAGCQDDWETFSIMRKSQYLTWDDGLLDSYLSDLRAAGQRGWNLIMEKYARMMESTAPEKYEALKQELPVRSPERLAIQEEIIRIQVAWMEDFAAKYPKMAGNARRIHTAEDDAFHTSYETYLRGELGTYSEETFVLYGRFVITCSKQGENLAYRIMENTAKLYGYASVEAAEAGL